jgi:hypothetical protein
MAKWTKRNNPHTWGRKKRSSPMARTRTQIVRYAPPRTVAPIIRVSAPRASHKKKHRRHHGGGDGALSQQRLISLALGGAAFGFIEKSFGAQLPTLPIIGRAGTITLVAYYFSKGRAGGILKDVARAGAVLAGYQIGTTGKISGEDHLLAGEVTPQVSGGIAAQV